VSHLLAAHDPVPALLSDPDWHVAFQNRGARALFARMRALAPELCIDPLDLREVLSERILGHLVPNLGDLLRGVLDGLYQLEPDPTCFGHAPSLLDVLPASDGPGHAIERAARSTAWEHPMRLHDGGVELSLELLSLPFAGGASGFALVLARPAGPSDLEPARDYFGRLCAAASDELPAR
jgi:hypothetical protein